MTDRSTYANVATLLALLLIASGCGKSTTTATGAVNRDTPKSVAKAFFQATYDGDRKTAMECVTSGPMQADLVEAMTVVSVGMRKATDAMFKRWGTKEIEQSGGSFDVTRIDPRLIDQGKETITGDTATIVTTKQTIHLARGNDGWRIDLARTFKLDEKTLAMAKPMFIAMGKAGEEVATEVEAGKYNNMAEGVNALKARIKQAIDAETKHLLENAPKPR